MNAVDLSGTDPKKEVEELAAAIEYTHPRTFKLGNLIGDHNEIHRDRQAAIDAGFLDMPIIGVDLMGAAGGIAQDLIEIGHDSYPGLIHTKLDVTFRHPVYHEDSDHHFQPQWHIGEIDYVHGKERKTIVAPFEARTEEEKNSLKLEASATLSSIPSVLPELNARHLVYRSAFQILDTHREAWNGLMNRPNPYIDPIHIAAIVPSICLEYTSAVNQITGNEVDVRRNISMSTLILNEMQNGLAFIDIYDIPGRKGEDVKRYAKRYEFGALVRQGDKPIIFSRVKAHTSGCLDTKAWINLNPDLRKSFPINN